MIVLLFCLSLLARAAGDASFVTLDWAEIGLDTVAPEYRRTEVLREGGAWQVSVEYPEFEPLSEAESRLVAPYAELIGEDIRVESEVYEVRGEWRITWHCLPLVYRDGLYQRLISARFSLSRVAQARAVAAVAASERYASRSAMASGRWVKITLTEDGMYRLTPAFIQKAGFADISRVRLYGYGGHLQSTSLKADADMDDLPEIPLYQASDGSLLFWGNGLVSWNGTKRVLNTYAREACYFLSDVSPDGGAGTATRISSVSAGTASGGTATSAMRHKLIENDEYAMYHVGNRLVSADNFSDGAERSYTFSGISASGSVQLTNVAFSYTPEQRLIEDLDLTVRPGERVAIVGPTGCGKTTLINLLMRFYDVKDGSIAVDGSDIRTVTRQSLRHQYGMVLQDTWLKSGTVRENIRLAKPDAADEEVEAAAKKAHADSFIRRLPNGYDTMLSDTGGALSAGQRQLLCIARVMLCLPPMLILDEATSSIDTRTEVKIQQAFDEMMQGRTSFVVAHRHSTIREADVILVMRDGHIVEQGKHDELLARNGFYAKLYHSQFEG